MSALLPPETKIWILSDGKIGDEVQCLGIVDALGSPAAIRRVAPRRFFALFMPYGPIDPRERPGQPRSPFASPFPDIVIAAGRRTVAYLRTVKKLAGGKVFTVFLKDPYVGTGAADLIWVPQHDRLRGDNVLVTPTPAHRQSAARLRELRSRDDSRLAGLAGPRLLLVLGGNSQHHRFSEADESALIEIARRALAAGFSLMVTGSRRTPGGLIAKIRSLLGSESALRAFVWDGAGENPYTAMLATAAHIVVTGDSVNMMAEAVATGAPVSIYEPSGGHAKMTRYIDYLIGTGAARRWTGSFESWTYTPIDATPLIAQAVAKRYLAWRSEGR